MWPTGPVHQGRIHHPLYGLFRFYHLVRLDYVYKTFYLYIKESGRLFNCVICSFPML